MKKIIISCSLLFICLCSQAQTKWTLRQCVDYATENNIELRQAALSVRNAEINVSSSKNSRLPDLNANMNQRFNFGRSPNMATGVYEDNKASNTSLYIASSTPLFTGFRIPNQIKADELTLQASMEGLKKAKENLELNVVSYYLDVLYNREILRAKKEQVELSSLQVERTKILVESGKVPASQLYDIIAQLAKDELAVTTAENNHALSLLNLSQSLNLPEYDKFDIVEPVLGDVIYNNISSLLPPQQVYQMAIGIKPHVKEAEYKVQSSEKMLKVAKADYWPTLNFDLSYDNGFSHVYKSGYDNPTLSNQLKNNQREVIGFTLSIPIFNRFQTRNKVRKARLDIENQELELDNIKLALYKEIQQAYQSAVSAQSEYTSTVKAYDAAEESFKYAQERYEIGKSSVFEFNEAKTKVLTSKSDQIRAKYDFLFKSKILDFYQGKPIDIE